MFLIIVLVIALISLLSYIISKRNLFNKLRRAVTQQGSDLGVQIAKRAESLNDALSIAKRAYENEVAGIDKLTPSQQINQLQYLGEIHPELMSIQGYNTSVSQSFELNKDITAARELLNGNVREYNDAITEFPALIVAKLLGYKQEKFIDEENIEENKKLNTKTVDFSKF